MIKRLKNDLKNFNLVFEKYIFDLKHDEVNCYALEDSSATITCPSQEILDTISNVLSNLDYHVSDIRTTSQDKLILRKLNVSI